MVEVWLFGQSHALLLLFRLEIAKDGQWHVDEVSALGTTD